MFHAIWIFFLHVTGSDNVSGPWYGFWSGFAGDLAIVALPITYLRHKNCHYKGCWRLGRHPKDHYVFCGKHHPDVD